MNMLGPGAKVYLVLGTTDMRKAIDGLSLLVAVHLEMDGHRQLVVRGVAENVASRY